MSKTLFKTVNMILVVLFTVSMVLTGCGSQSGKQESTETQASTQEQTTQPEEKEYTYIWFSSSSPDNDDVWGFKYMKEKFNIVLKKANIDETQKAESLNLLLASGVIPDLLFDAGVPASELQKKEVIAELSESMVKENMPGFYDLILKTDPKAFKYCYIDGKLYSLPLPSASSLLNPNSIEIRGDWLTNVGADIPKTLDELEAVFMKFRNDDPDKDGKRDTYAMSASFPQGWDDWGTPGFQSIFGAFGANPMAWKELDGKLIYGFTYEGTRDALKLLNKWYKAELIDPEFITDQYRTSSNDDISFKFASGRIGYMDNLTTDDSQWDNDGQMNAKWVANNPEWKKYFEDNKNDPEKLYATKNFFMEIPANPPAQPVYINLAPPVGPKGESGTLGYNAINPGSLVFGKNLEKDTEKFAKLLRVLEVLAMDKEAVINTMYGPEGKMWKYGENGKMMLNPDWEKDPLYDPQNRKLGVGYSINPMWATNADTVTALDIPRTSQRWERCFKVVNENVKIIKSELTNLPSRSNYPDLETTVLEYIIKAITGSVDIDATYDATVQKWMQNGGEVLTREANEWFSSMK